MKQSMDVRLGVGVLSTKATWIRYAPYNHVVLCRHFGNLRSIKNDFEEDKTRRYGIAYGMGFGYLIHVLAWANGMF